jgi:hypothetical protein
MRGTGLHEIQQSCPHNATDNETLWRAAVKSGNLRSLRGMSDTWK